MSHFEVIIYRYKKYQVVKNNSLLFPQFFCLFFLVFWITPISSSWWLPSNGQEFFLNLCLLALLFFATILPLKKLTSIIITSSDPIITIIITIIIMPHIYPLPRNKPIENILQRGRSIFHCVITHFMRLKMLWDMQVWIYGHCLVAHFLGFKVISNKF